MPLSDSPAPAYFDPPDPVESHCETCGECWYPGTPCDGKHDPCAYHYRQQRVQQSIDDALDRRITEGDQ